MRTLRVNVKPNSRVEELVALEDGSYVARVKAPPVDGKANSALIALIAAKFGVPKSKVAIKSGASARTKRVLIAD